MQREQLYHKTVDILVQAYFNDTLQHGNCFACAVGNIVAANCGIKFQLMARENKRFYDMIVKPLTWEGYGIDIKKTITYFAHDNGEYPQELSYQIIKSGYSFKELNQIEQAFESAVSLSYEPKFGQTDDEAMFNGLMNVIDALDEIHENKDEATTQSSKKKFTKETILL